MTDPITVSVSVAAPRNVAFAVFTDPEHIVRWNAASPDWHCPRATQDLRVGGRFTSRMEACDGSEGFDFSGVYTAVVPGESLAYTMDDGRTVTISFTEAGGVTTVTETFDPETENSRELQAAGWQSILDSYARAVLENR